jgi:hypothetical protein
LVLLALLEKIRLVHVLIEQRLESSMLVLEQVLAVPLEMMKHSAEGCGHPANFAAVSSRRQWPRLVHDQVDWQ